MINNAFLGGLWKGGGRRGDVPSGLSPLLHLLVYGLVDAVGLVVVLVVGAAGKQADLVLGVLVAVVVVVVVVVFLLVRALCPADSQQAPQWRDSGQAEAEDKHMRWALAGRVPLLAGRGQP